MTLAKDKWEKTRLGDIVSELRNTSANPIEEGYLSYVGFEHIESENLYITDVGNLNDGITFKKTFCTNDVLFGKIRAYLKKVAIAPFDGICSGDILVLRTMNKEKMSQEILPYFLTTQVFLKRAVDSSIGTTLPRTKWQHLSRHEIHLPSIEEQSQITALFKSLEEAMKDSLIQINNLKRLRSSLSNKIANRDLSLSKKFNLSNWEKIKIDNVASWYQKDIPNNEQNEFGIEYYITADHIEPDEPLISKFSRLDDTKKGPTITKHFRIGDLLLSTRSIALHKAAVAKVAGVTGEKLIVIDVPNESRIVKGLLPYIMQSDLFWEYANITASGSVNKFSSWNKIKEYEFYLPKLEEQKVFVELFNQIEITLTHLTEQRVALKNLKEKLLNEILG